MESSDVKTKKRDLLPLSVLATLVASLLPDIILIEWSGSLPIWLPLLKLLVLLVTGTVSFHFDQTGKVLKYIVILGTIILIGWLTQLLSTAGFWKSAFDQASFIQNIGSNMILKLIGIIPVTGVLTYLYKSPNEVYLCKGDTSVKADRIKWLGIEKDMISWGKLSLISGVLIALGTILLTLVTVTGTTGDININKLIHYFPVIVLFAIVNSLCEGIIYRSAILGTLKNVLSKPQVILIAAMFFGVGHFYGIPRGIAGVVLSGVLGWYMCRSMYETKGFVSSWFIHAMQDAVIFSTLVLMSSLY